MVLEGTMYQLKWIKTGLRGTWQIQLTEMQIFVNKCLMSSEYLQTQINVFDWYTPDG